MIAQIAPDLFHWTARHPEWHPGEWGAEVGSYAALTETELLVIDPLLPADEPDPVLAELDARLAERVSILITIGYHVRSTEALWERWRGDVPVEIYGPPQAGRRLPGGARKAFRELEPADEGPAGARVFRIGRPVRGERPLWLPTHAALAFGDALVANPAGELRMWDLEPLTEHRASFYRDRFAPTLRPMLELPVERVLVTHGAPILEDAAAALRRAVDSPPWFHRG